MQQQVLILTKAQQVIQARLGRPLADHVRDEYIGKGRNLDAVASELGIGVSTLSRWLKDLGIEARRPGNRSEAVS